MELYDVIVIGAGPAGSCVAAELAGHGRRVLVLEKKQRPGEAVCCTGIIGQECAGEFAIEEEVVLRRVNSARLYSPSGNEIHLQRPEPQACILDRAAFDLSLAERARRAGASFEFQCRVTDIAITAEGVGISASCRGKMATFRADAAVIAAGFGSGLCRRLGLGVCGDFAVGAQAEVAAAGVDEVEVYFGDVAPGFFAWLVPAAAPVVRAGLLARKSPAPYLKNWLEALAGCGRIASADVGITCGAVPLKPLPRTYGERLLVVGDAAGQVKPTSAGGIYYGLIGARLAGETLHRALEDGDLSAKRLSGYERRWRRKLGRELRTGYWARSLFERLSNRQVDRIFEVVKARGIDAALLKTEELSFDWHSRTIMSLLKYQVVSSVARVIKLPFGSG